MRAAQLRQRRNAGKRLKSHGKYDGLCGRIGDGDFGEAVFASMLNVLGRSQVTAKKMELAPPWSADKAKDEEAKFNWDGAYEEIRETDVPRQSNVISSHFV